MSGIEYRTDKRNISKIENPLAYGGHINNEEIREKSSSGGVFSILSKYVLDKGGYVCGARFTKGGICEHVIEIGRAHV